MLLDMEMTGFHIFGQDNSDKVGHGAGGRINAQAFSYFSAINDKPFVVFLGSTSTFLCNFMNVLDGILLPTYARSLNGSFLSPSSRSRSRDCDLDLDVRTRGPNTPDSGSRKKVGIYFFIVARKSMVLLMFLCLCNGHFENVLKEVALYFMNEIALQEQYTTN